MLQQTQVATVVDYYERFLNSFPTVNDLAEAEESEVLALWSGLGYYRRARQLHAAAKKIRDEFGGEFPTRFEDILDLPGVGKYTAGAISSFAFGQTSPILEANTIRLFSRLIGLRDLPTTSKSQRLLWQFAADIHSNRSSRKSDTESLNPGLLNQSVMELGSLVCKPAKPVCDACPIHMQCHARELGIEHLIPLKKERTSFEDQTHMMVLLEADSKYLLRRNQPGEWWAGLWDFPRIDVSELSKTDQKLLNSKTDPSRNQLVGLNAKLEELLGNKLGIDCQLQSKFRTIKHGVTRYRITLHCFEAEIIAGSATEVGSQVPGDCAWFGRSELVTLPLTSTSSKITSGLISE